LLKPLLFIAVVVCGQYAVAAPWAEQGDTRLRHDLQLLGDSGLLNVPLTTWPISWGDVSQALESSPSAATNVSVMAAYQRVENRLEIENKRQIKLNAGLSVATTPIRFRTFSDTARETAEAKVGVEWMGDILALKLQGATVRDPQDGKQYRLDGSYAGLALGNWMLSAGSMDRWWGPGWEGSLIMSNNARPVPGFTIQRNYSDPFDLPVLRWLGPWNFTFFTGKLEKDRVIPDALLTGMRLSFKPTSKIEIGLSRTSQWGGQGRPTGFKTFFKMLAGQDNRGNSGITLANEPGNQLAGYDVRWRSPIGELPYALYTQWIGEDEAGMLPSRFIAMGGAELWGDLGDMGASWRLHVEYTNTLAGFYKSKPFYNYAYEHHGIYRSGYRYYGQSMGHAIDGNGRMLSIGGVIVDDSGRLWEALLRKNKFNRFRAKPEEIWSLELQQKTETQFGDFQIGANLYRTTMGGGSGISHNGSLEMQWEVHL